MKSKLIFFLILLAQLTSAQDTFKFPPKDETEQSPTLKAFVTELKLIIKERNGTRLLKHLHPEIKVDFDDAVGIEKFKEMWKPEDKTSGLWTVLDRITSMGGVFTKNKTESFYKFVFPYVTAVDLEDADQYFSTLVVLKQNVNVRDKPDAKSTIVGQLSYDIVTFDYEKSKDNFYYITTQDETIKGYINDTMAYSPIDHRMYLTEENGKWLISCIVAGD